MATDHVSSQPVPQGQGAFEIDALPLPQLGQGGAGQSFRRRVHGKVIGTVGLHREADTVDRNGFPICHLRHEKKRPEEEQLSERQVLRNIRRIDRNRARTREILTGRMNGDGSTFDLTVNTTGWEIKKLTGALADFALRWFEN